MNACTIGHWPGVQMQIPEVVPGDCDVLVWVEGDKFYALDVANDIITGYSMDLTDMEGVLNDLPAHLVIGIRLDDGSIGKIIPNALQ